MSRKTISFGKISLAAGAGGAAEASATPASGFGSFGRTPIEEQPDVDELSEDLETQHVHEVMGIKNFGKKAKSFNIQEMMLQAKEAAREVAKKKEEADAKAKQEELVKEKDEQAKVTESVPPDEEDDDIIGPPLPPDLTTHEDVGPPIPPGHEKTADEKADDKTKTEDDGEDSYDDLSDSDDDEDLEKKIPISDMVSLQHGARAVSALAADPAGARLASGAMDYDVCLWDFAGMDSALRPFRTVRPADGHPVVALQYSASGHALLAAAAAQARVLDRDGVLRAECVKGDQYITDMGRTKGHTAALTGCGWHPAAREEFLTASADGSVRVWCAERPAQHRALLRPRCARGLRAPPSAAGYARDGRAIVAGCVDGSLQFWDTRGSFVRPSKVIRGAHAAQCDVTSVSYAHAAPALLSRSTDDSMKLWDLRRMDQPVHTWTDLYTRYSQTDCTFSPDDRLAVTGTSRRGGGAGGGGGDGGGGGLVVCDARGGGVVRAVPLDTHAVRVVWHPRLGQLLVGAGDGTVRVLHGAADARGAAGAARRAGRRRAGGGVVGAQQILTPHALPLFRADRLRTGKKQAARDRGDPLRSRRPDLPLTAGRGGRVAASGSTLSSYVIRNLGLATRVEDNQDPREAILKYAAAAAEHPFWVAPAYKRTQPTPIFQDDGPSDEKKDKK